uniref:Uncharacterized protein n=1 Tax=Anguilla anguilla TaxID=7936 RepID=A0A0E9RGH1_ANGAN
MEELVDAGVV